MLLVIVCVCEEPPAEEKIVAIPQSAAMPCDALGMATIFMLYLVDICMFNTCIAYHIMSLESPLQGQNCIHPSICSFALIVMGMATILS